MGQLLDNRPFDDAIHTEPVVEGVAFAKQLPAGDNWNYLGKGMNLDPAGAQ
jgi:hypothetical protein